MSEEPYSNQQHKSQDLRPRPQMSRCCYWRYARANRTPLTVFPPGYCYFARCAVLRRSSSSLAYPALSHSRSRVAART
jgi:hypothetical protein